MKKLKDAAQGKLYARAKIENPAMRGVGWERAERKQFGGNFFHRDKIAGLASGGRGEVSSGTSGGEGGGEKRGVRLTGAIDRERPRDQPRKILRTRSRKN